MKTNINLLICDMIDNNTYQKLNYGLPQWFENIKYKTFKELKAEDISRMIRQKFLIKPAIMEANIRIKDNPTLGLYDGELIFELSKIEKQFWIKNEDLRISTLKTIIDIQNSEFLRNFEWLSKEDETEFYKNIDTLKTTLNVI